MKPKEYLKQLEIEISMGDNYDEIQKSKYRLEGATVMYELMARAMRAHEQTDKRKEYKKNYYKAHRQEARETYKKYYQAHKEEIREYQRNYRAKKKQEADATSKKD